ERIFDLFVQEHRSGLHGNKGLGIGLALTRRLVTLHGGTVTARSEGEGAGSAFVLRLPVLPADGPDAGSPAVEAGGEQAAQRGATVLVVDDNVDAADTVAELLELSGVATRKAYTGEEALQVYEAHGADALILDIGLPGIDGHEVCRRIRARAAGPQPVVVALTGWGQDSDREHALQAGFDEHLAKPADIERLMAVLNRLLGRGA
ncbi:MAG: response regulator, partial [Comamonadaceae bacterium]